MKKTFWNTLERPIVGLAPMDGVTDAPMRFITAKYGRPDVIFTEFVSAEGIWHTSRTLELKNSRTQGAERLLRDLVFDEIERPVVAQLFGGDPEAFFEVSKLIVKMGFDGVDINMGCPARKVAGRGEGAGLIKNPELAGEIIAAVKRGVKEATKLRSYEGTNLGKNMEIPVSVKTRIGYDKADPEWWKFLATQDLAAVTVHGRTFKQLYQGIADWEAIGEAATLIKQSGAVFLGSGDIGSRQQAVVSCQKYGTDGALIGRGAMGNPWAFEKTQELKNSKTQKLAVALEHARKFEEIFPNDTLPAGRQGFFIMRKHLSWYARGFDGAADLRQKLVLCNSADEVEKAVYTFEHEDKGADIFSGDTVGKV
ncbi:tRNA-dihydrouridine synthase [Candidatus Collierbacteria bacterium]|nr:tRNA-dihydrouridine synthase [Candidatus Collierbacteria bacterium]